MEIDPKIANYPFEGLSKFHNINVKRVLQTIRTPK